MHWRLYANGENKVRREVRARKGNIIPVLGSRAWHTQPIAEGPAEPLTLSILSAGERFAHGGRV